MKYIDADKLRAWVEENKKVLNLGTRFYLENSIENIRIDETKLDILLIKDFLSYLSAEEQEVEVIEDKDIIYKMTDCLDYLIPDKVDHIIIVKKGGVE